MMRIWSGFLAGAVCAALLTWSMPASSGIIVTVGKLAVVEQDSDGDDGGTHRGGRFDSKDPAPGMTHTNPYGSSRDHVGGVPMPDAAPIDEGEGYEGQGDYVEGGAYDDDYDTSECEPIGGGLLYCEHEDGAGAGVGPGRGGSLGDLPNSDPLEDGEIATMGCGVGGGPLQPLLAFALGFTGLFWVRRRV